MVILVLNGPAAACSGSYKCYVAETGLVNLFQLCLFSYIVSTFKEKDGCFVFFKLLVSSVLWYLCFNM